MKYVGTMVTAPGIIIVARYRPNSLPEPRNGILAEREGRHAGAHNLHSSAQHGQIKAVEGGADEREALSC